MLAKAKFLFKTVNRILFNELPKATSQRHRILIYANYTVHTSINQVSINIAPCVSRQR